MRMLSENVCPKSNWMKVISIVRQPNQLLHFVCHWLSSCHSQPVQTTLLINVMNSILFAERNKIYHLLLPFNSAIYRTKRISPVPDASGVVRLCVQFSVLLMWHIAILKTLKKCHWLRTHTAWDDWERRFIYKLWIAWVQPLAVRRKLNVERLDQRARIALIQHHLANSVMRTSSSTLYLTFALQSFLMVKLAITDAASRRNHLWRRLRCRRGKQGTQNVWWRCENHIHDAIVLMPPQDKWYCAEYS